MTNAIKNRGRPPDLRDQIAAHLRARAALQGRITPTTTSRIASEVGASRDYTGKVLRSWPAWFVRVGYKRSRHVYWKPSPALVLEALPDDEDATNT